MEYITRGKTVEEALERGLKEQGWQRDEVEVEVIDPGKQGIIFKREAVVKIIRRSVADKTGTHANKERDLSQLIQLENGQFRIDPELFQRQVILHPPQKTVILINELTLNKRTLITPTDVVTIAGAQANLEEWIDLKVTADGLEASIQLFEHMAYELSWHIKETKERVDIVFQETLRHHLPFDSKDILLWLKEKGIIFGVDHQAIQHWVQEGFKTLTPLVVARGKAKIDGQSTQFIELYHTQDTPKTIEDDEKVDWFELRHVESVTAGEAILQIVPPTPGEDGQDIYGRVIPAENGKEIKIQLGKGVEWSSDGLHVIATMDGRPELSAGKISIQPIYAVNGDLTLETGSIHFNGDVLISGDVQEGLSIEATGSVEVRGSVTQAKIIAGKNIIVAKNVISSHLTAGGLGSVYQQLLDRINRVINHLNILISGYQQLHMLPAFNKEKFDGGPGQVIKLIIESKLHNFNDVLKHLEDAYAQSGLEEDQLEHWLKQVKQKLTGLGLFSIKSLEEVEQLVQTGSELKRAWEDYQDEECLIQVGYIHNSTVRAHGSIYVKGSGVYNSKLYADQSIYVMGRPGVVRGGYLEAGQMVQVRELGVSSGVKAHILIRNEHGRILADHLYPGITMTINGINYDQEKYSRNVQVYYDGEIHSIRVGGLI